MSANSANRLIHETSPYLLQHAYNPVDWYPWGEQALQKAKEEDKPIIVSIGYSSCHWCHVMERESFEDVETASLMNQHFVNIKVDREERPDIDQIYMEAVQALTGSGGWPLNVFLLPDKRPFYGGTYFPPRPYQNMPSWTQLLNGVLQSFREKRQQVEEQADKITNHIQGIDSLIIQQELSSANDHQNAFSEQDLTTVYTTFSQTFDVQKGGFSKAPKFPNAMNIDFLLRYGHLQGNTQATDHALFSLRQMIAGGIYDQIGGGFARYSTDPDWLVPHFEKMLYDNALLVGSLSDAYKLTKDPMFHDAIEETLSFVERDMTSPNGGFYSALDADSEGEEGKFYVWTKEQIDQLLQEDANWFEEFFGVTEQGNWEGVNILHRTSDAKSFAEEKGISVEQLQEQFQRNKQTLLEARGERAHPGLDDKILLAWNALMAKGFVKAYSALGDKRYMKRAKQNLDFLLSEFQVEGKPGLKHSFQQDKQATHAFLDDYAYLIDALIHFYFATFDEEKLNKAIELTNYVDEQFYDQDTALFYFTPDNQEDVLFRKKDLFDNAIPSSNAIMASNLHRLGVIEGNFDYFERVQTMLQRIWPTLVKYPSGFGQWSQVIISLVYPTPEIAVVGKDYQQKAFHLQNEFIPDYVIMATSKKDATEFPLLKDKSGEENTYIYVCQNYSCQQPVDEVPDALASLSPEQMLQ